MPKNGDVCRICLAVNVQMNPITDSPVQIVYEKLTNASLVSDERQPATACYICYARLKNSYKLMLTATKAQDVFTDILKRYAEVTVQSVLQADPQTINLFGKLIVSNAELIDTTPVANVIKSDDDVKEELENEEFQEFSEQLQSENDVIDENTASEEMCGSEIYEKVNKIEIEEDSQQLTSGHNDGSDSDGDVPLARVQSQSTILKMEDIPMDIHEDGVTAKKTVKRKRTKTKSIKKNEDVCRDAPPKEDGVTAKKTVKRKRTKTKSIKENEDVCRDAPPKEDD